MTSHPSLDFAVQAILAYLQQRPDAADTLEGIHHWWISWPGPEESPAVTLAALEQLESRGMVTRVLLGQRSLWRRAPTR